MRRDIPLPGVTAVVPAYNMEAFLERTLTSAIRQTYPELDIIVVDDGSTDATRAVAERIAATHDRMRVESVANAGVAAARNLGARLARTPYVAYLDADDLWHPEKIARQVAALTVHGQDGEWAGCYTLSRYIGIADEVLGSGPSVEARGDFFEKHLEHFAAMLDFYAGTLAAGGQVVTDRVGLGWTSANVHPRWAFDFDDLAAVAGHAGLRAFRPGGETIVLARDRPVQPGLVARLASLLRRARRALLRRLGGRG